jgi:hypothetical protein
MADRIDTGFKLVDPIYARFLKKLIEGKSPRAAQLRVGLDLLRTRYSGIIEILWEDIVALNSTTPRETIAKVGHLLTPTDRIPGFGMAMKNYKACLLSVSEAINYRQELTKLSETYSLSKESLPFLHRHIRDATVWEAAH